MALPDKDVWTRYLLDLDADQRQSLLYGSWDLVQPDIPPMPAKPLPGASETGRYLRNPPDMHHLPPGVDAWGPDGRLIEFKTAQARQQGKTLAQADYSSLEKRIMAYCTGDANVHLCFNNDFNYYADELTYYALDPEYVPVAIEEHFEHFPTIEPTLKDGVSWPLPVSVNPECVVTVGRVLNHKWPPKYFVRTDVNKFVITATPGLYIQQFGRAVRSVKPPTPFICNV